MQPSSPQKGKLRGQSSAQTHDATHHGWLRMVGCLVLRPKIWESFRIVRVRIHLTFPDLSNLPIIPRSGASVYYDGMMVLETGFVWVWWAFSSSRKGSIYPYASWMVLPYLKCWKNAARWICWIALGRGQIAWARPNGSNGTSFGPANVGWSRLSMLMSYQLLLCQGWQRCLKKILTSKKSHHTLS